ncbi:MAG: alpha/beta hydrolase [Gammaproteobacteria bacterium]|nr:alpha/beta hydrolase [Gammaproteobacteria bacterium]
MSRWLMALWLLLGAAQALAGGRIEVMAINMVELGERPRMVRIYLPPDYDKRKQRYPVLYMHDGQFVFTGVTFNNLGADRIIDQLVADQKLRPLIVVAIDNGEARWDEYSPVVNRQMSRWVGAGWTDEAEGGEGSAYLRFVANQLKPKIDGRYRTLTDAANTGIGGASMGGVISLYALLGHPATFGKVLALSPAVWFSEGGGGWLSNNDLVKRLATPGLWLQPYQRIYLDIGTREWQDGRPPEGLERDWPAIYLEGAQAAIAALTRAGVAGEKLKLVIDEGADHHEAAWAARFGAALIWLYGPPVP